MFTKSSTLVMAAAIAAAVLPSSAQGAGGTITSSCSGPWSMRNCVLQWREGVRDPHIVHAAGPRNEIEAREAEARDRKWLARCRPVIRTDRYGVGRYHYAKPGCEFGQTED